MMFSLADDDFIARLKPRTCVALGHHIDGLGGAARPDNIFPAFGIYQPCDPIASGLIARSKMLRFSVLAAMHIACTQAVELLRCFNDRLRLQGRGSAIKVNTGIGQRRKLCAKVRRTESVHGIPRVDKEIVAQFHRQGKEVGIYKICLHILATSEKQVMLNSVRWMF